MIAGPTAYVAVFGAGVASFLSPCVLPLLPAYVGVMTGAEATPGRIARSSVLFVGGFSAVFVAIGALAGRIGKFADGLQTWMLRVGGVVVIALGLLLLGVGRTAFAIERRVAVDLSHFGGIARPIVMGLTFGAAWTPCVGPLLGSALVVAAQSSDPWRGASLLAAYAVGVGVPFIAVALAMTSSSQILKGLRRISARLEPVAGAVLVALGVLLLTGWYARALGLIARLRSDIT